MSADAFRDVYRLKAEPVGFCRAHGLPVSGGKGEPVARIAAFLRDGTVVRPAPPSRRPQAKLPDVLTLGTRIGAGWRCGQPLRAFFEVESGPSFRFNQALVAFVRDGRTLGEAPDVWRVAAGPAPLAAQFEYNRYTRGYRAAHPAASPGEVRAAWWAKRSRPRSG